MSEQQYTSWISLRCPDRYWRVDWRDETHGWTFGGYGSHNEVTRMERRLKEQGYEVRIVAIW